MHKKPHNRTWCDNDASGALHDKAHEGTQAPSQVGHSRGIEVYDARICSTAALRECRYSGSPPPGSQTFIAHLTGEL